ncbi:hypothetical protein GOY11_34250, partial [Pseudomonas aeruginosa]|nr:hypothetical protein [Pseudomonas aeruginosa]
MRTHFYLYENALYRDCVVIGLGLAIAQQLRLALGVRLNLANRAGGGLCARIELDASSACTDTSLHALVGHTADEDDYNQRGHGEPRHIADELHATGSPTQT